MALDSRQLAYGDIRSKYPPRIDIPVRKAAFRVNYGPQKHSFAEHVRTIYSCCRKQDVAGVRAKDPKC